MTNALVTGATGFLGQHVCLRLNRMGWNVTGMGRSESVGASLEKQGVRFVQADLRDEESVVRACAGQEVVFHCGALSSPWGPYREFEAVNVGGTKHVAAGCRKHEVRRFIHISTPTIYFDNRDRLDIREDDRLPAKPINAYAATKLLAERVAFQAFADGQPGLILRPRAIFGPLDRALFPRLMRANDSRGIPLIKGGNVRLDLTYVDNVVDAMLLGWEAPHEALGQAYNITNGEPAILRNVLEKLFAMMGVRLRTRTIPYPVAYGAAALLEWSHRMLPVLGEPALTRYTIGVMSRSQTLDITLARERLGYAPRVGLHEGLRAFAEWWSSIGR
ncbi:NAD-dependent epimerase/dehydratase family protein [Cohnella faecalis]|uniref:NAD-dependent epimerase/dehydratase family protein n=1 Tax=Cohnella faecalis TaxID=2315694 RepID=A0A398CV75_9BACL|nr:NAD-dependent epimerase/dehydratase family protein [Cohnella faecalis]RIE02934.1 NAD-dependent epimerase/dehydratase family protein [Cohnella faecalis]